jgi:hypothetical protein
VREASKARYCFPSLVLPRSFVVVKPLRVLICILLLRSTVRIPEEIVLYLVSFDIDADLSRSKDFCGLTSLSV